MLAMVVGAVRITVYVAVGNYKNHIITTATNINRGRHAS